MVIERERGREERGAEDILIAPYQPFPSPSSADRTCAYRGWRSSRFGGWTWTRAASLLEEEAAGVLPLTLSRSGALLVSSIMNEVLKNRGGKSLY